MKSKGASGMPDEHIEQVTFVQWFRRTFDGVRIFAIPNGGYRSKTTAGRLRAEGVSPGVPDLFVPEWRLWIEMKRRKGGVVSPDQRDWIAYLERCGYHCIIARGWEDGVRQITDFRAG